MYSAIHSYFGQVFFISVFVMDGYFKKGHGLVKSCWVHILYICTYVYVSMSMYVLYV